MKQVLTFLFLSNIAFAQIPNPHRVAYNWKTDTSQHTTGFADLTIAAAKDEIAELVQVVARGMEQLHPLRIELAASDEPWV